MYIWAVSTGQILETSLGYYINPLVNVLIGFLFLHERPTRLQGVAIGVAAAGVLWSFWGQNGFPWLGLSLAFTFALYGYIRKTVSVEALPGLFMETVVLTPLALGCIAWLYGHGEGFLLQPKLWEGFLLFASGTVTSLPMVLFAYAARHMRSDDTGPLAVYFSYLRLLPRHFRLPSGAESLRAVYLCVHLAGASSLYL